MKYITGICFLICLVTITAGFYYWKKPNIESRERKLRNALLTNGTFFVIVFLMATMIIYSQNVSASQMPAATAAVETSPEGSGSGLGFIAAALATGLATLGAGYAVGSVGSSALGAVSEDPGILGKTLIFVGLAEGIAIYGLIVSILILGRL